MTIKIEKEECNLIYIKSIRMLLKKLRQNNDF